MKVGMRLEIRLGLRPKMILEMGHEKKVWAGTRNGLSILEQRQTFTNLK